MAVMLFCLALLAPLGQLFGLWPIVSVGGVVSGLLLWGALRDESIAGPVVGLVLTNLAGMFVGDGPALGPLAGVALAVALGEHLSMMQHSRYATPGHAVRWSGSGPVAAHGVVAALAMAATIGAARLPGGRAWSVAVIAALVLVGAVVGRRRSSLPDDL